MNCPSATVSHPGAATLTMNVRRLAPYSGAVPPSVIHFFISYPFDISSNSQSFHFSASICGPVGGRPLTSPGGDFDPGFLRPGGKSSTRYYYDADQGRCLPFEYAGGLGNYNNFVTKLDCELFCSRRRLFSILRKSVNVFLQSFATTVARCESAKIRNDVNRTPTVPARIHAKPIRMSVVRQRVCFRGSVLCGRDEYCNCRNNLCSAKTTRRLHKQRPTLLV